MKNGMYVFLLLLSGCFSFTEQRVEFERMTPAKGRCYYIERIELTDGLKKIPVGDTDLASARCGKIRANLCRNAPEWFTENPAGAIPLTVKIHAYQNADGKFPGFLKPDQSGVASQNMLLQKHTNWAFIYEISCVLGAGEKGGKVVKNVNGTGSRVEINAVPGIMMLVMAPFSNLHFDGVELFFGMLDSYDWLQEEEFAEVMKSVVAELELD